MILPHMNNAFSQKYVSLFEQRIELHITKNHLPERIRLFRISIFIRNDRMAYNSIEYASTHENCIIFLCIDTVYS